MNIADKNTERSTLLVAVLALVIIGASLLLSTWQTLSHQKVAEEEHLLLTTRAVFLAVESSLRRGPYRESNNRLSPRSAELFASLQRDGDVLFVEMIDASGTKLFTSNTESSPQVPLPPEALNTLFRTGEWHGRLDVGKHTAYVYASKISQKGMAHHNMKGRDYEQPVAYMVVGIDLEHHSSAYRSFRKNAIFQALYILGAALFTWGLAISFLSRREQAKKAITLEQFQATLLDHLPDGLLSIGQEKNKFIVLSANPAALSILGMPPQTLIGSSTECLPQPVATYIHELSVAGFNENHWQRIQTSNSYLEILALPIQQESKHNLLLIIRDRTQLRSLEKNLANAEKLAAIGSLATGIAHEVRNPLSALRGFAQYFVKKLHGQQPEEEYAKTMVREADRLNRVITDLLFLAKPKALQPTLIHLPSLTQELSSLLRFELEKRHISICLDLQAEHVYADPESLKQALLNLLINSLDALPLTPSIPDYSGTAPSLQIISTEDSQGVWLSVKDNGCGMTQEQQQHAFEAFFTGKEHGTGLGLALVAMIMLDHSGTASVTSSPGEGCCICLFFPHKHAASLVEAPNAFKTQL